MRFGYADPPYVGQAKKHYGKEASYAGEVDHAALIARLNLYDGWALSCSTPSLGYLLPLCPPDVRIGAWVKPFAIFKPNVNPSYSWEPVIYRGARKRDRTEPTVKDFCVESITLRRGLVGVKPEKFCFWLFDLLGLQSGDSLDDLFPGSGAVTVALEKWRAQLRLAV